MLKAGSTKQEAGSRKHEAGSTKQEDFDRIERINGINGINTGLTRLTAGAGRGGGVKTISVNLIATAL